MRRVIKVGGSLLLRSGLPDQLRCWVDQQAPARNLLLVGGGELIDAVRNLDRVRAGDPAFVHWLCVDLLECTLAIVASWFPQWSIIDSPRGLQAVIESDDDPSETSWVSVGAFYRPDTGSNLPLDWGTTTDSIAAELAIQVSAGELVLLKSCEVDPRAEVEELAEAGVVDAALPSLAARVASLRVEKLPGG